MPPEFAALSAALCWSFCSLAFASAGRKVGASAVNQIRILLAVPILAVLQLVLLGTIWTDATLSDQWLLALSGWIGLTLGDLFHFRAMSELGPRLGLLLNGTWPVMAAVLAWFTRGELLGAAEIAGVCLVALGTSAVVMGGDRRWNPGRVRKRAVALGLLGAIGQASGAVLAKEALDHGVDPLTATTVRMTAALAGMVLLALLWRQMGAAVAATRDGPALRQIAIGTVLGPVLGVWLSLIALAGADTGKAAPLMATAPIFMLPIGWFAYRAPIAPVAVVGTLLACAGAYQLWP